MVQRELEIVNARADVESTSIYTNNQGKTKLTLHLHLHLHLPHQQQLLAFSPPSRHNLQRLPDIPQMIVVGQCPTILPITRRFSYPTRLRAESQCSDGSSNSGNALTACVCVAAGGSDPRPYRNPAMDIFTINAFTASFMITIYIRDDMDDIISQTRANILICRFAQTDPSLRPLHAQPTTRLLTV